jgi:hypothetical protein
VWLKLTGAVSIALSMLLSLLAPDMAVAQSNAESPSISVMPWPFAPPCLSDQGLAAGIQTTLGYPVQVGAHDAQIQVHVVASASTLTLRVTGNAFEATRSLESASGCEGMVDAAIVVAALLVDDAMRTIPAAPPARPLTPPAPTAPTSMGTIAARVPLSISGLAWPSVALGVGVEVELGYRLDPQTSLSAIGGMQVVPDYEASAGEERVAVGARLGRLGVALRLDVVPELRLALALLGSAGAVRVEGRSLGEPRGAERLFAMVEAEVAARLRLIGPLGIRLGVGTAAVVTPIVLRYRDGAGQEVQAFSSAAFALLGSLAIDVEFD